MNFIPFSTVIAPGALASNAVGFQAITTLGEDLFILGVKATWAQENGTLHEGPMECGYAHGDLSAAEVVEALDANLSDPDDIIAREKSRRPVRRAGMFSSPSATGLELTLAHGTPIKTICKFTVGDGHTFVVWVRNKHSAALTSGTTINVNGFIYGRWLR